MSLGNREGVDDTADRADGRTSELKEGKRPRVLYLHPTTVPPSLDPRRNAAYHLSRYLDGDVVSFTWDTWGEYRSKRNRYRDVMGAWGYHASTFQRRGLLLTIWRAIYMVAKAFQLTLRRGRYDAVVAYSPFTPAWAGLAVKLLTRSRLIVQIPVNPHVSMVHYAAPLSRFKTWFFKATFSVLLRYTDRLHLMYSEQGRALGHDPLPPASAFPDFIPTSLVPRNRGDDRFILFLGAPWHLKGVDILIRAFLKLSTEFPDVRLKIIGHCPDDSEYRQLAQGHARIDLLNRGIPNEEAMDLMSRCSFLVLPSRTEGMPRVIQEAWAAGKAVVASAVDGIPYYVTDQVNGLLVPSEDSDALCGAMRRILEDPEEARRMGEAGARLVHSQFGEDHYARNFFQMVEAAIHRPHGVAV